MKHKRRSNKQKKITGKKIAFLGAAGLCLLALLGFCAFRLYAAHTSAADKAAAKKIYRQSGRKPAGMINGEPFFQEDLAVYAAELRAAVAAHYGKKYGLSAVGASFWDTEYDGATPREFMNKLALNDLARNMVLIQQARKRGIDAPQTYHDLEEERAEWNNPGDEIIYGPKTLGPAEYNSYRISGISDELKTVLLKKELAPTTAQLKASFDSLNEGLKAAPWLASGVRFSWDAPAVPNGEIRAAIERSLGQGLSPEALVDTLSASYPGLSQEPFEVNSRYVSKEEAYDQELAAILSDAGKGSCVSGPEDRPELYYITEKMGGGILTFEQAPLLGRNKWINDQFDIFLTKKTKAARITLCSDADFGK